MCKSVTVFAIIIDYEIAAKGNKKEAKKMTYQILGRMQSLSNSWNAIAENNQDFYWFALVLFVPNP